VGPAGPDTAQFKFGFSAAHVFCWNTPAIYVCLVLAASHQTLRTSARTGVFADLYQTKQVCTDGRKEDKAALRTRK